MARALGRQTLLGLPGGTLGASRPQGGGLVAGACLPRSPASESDRGRGPRSGEGPALFPGCAPHTLGAVAKGRHWATLSRKRGVDICRRGDGALVCILSLPKSRRGGRGSPPYPNPGTDGADVQTRCPPPSPEAPLTLGVPLRRGDTGPRRAANGESISAAAATGRLFASRGTKIVLGPVTLTLGCDGADVRTRRPPSSRGVPPTLWVPLQRGDTGPRCATNGESISAAAATGRSFVSQVSPSREGGGRPHRGSPGLTGPTFGRGARPLPGVCPPHFGYHCKEGTLGHAVPQTGSRYLPRRRRGARLHLKLAEVTSRRPGVPPDPNSGTDGGRVRTRCPPPSPEAPLTLGVPLRRGDTGPRCPANGESISAAAATGRSFAS